MSRRELRALPAHIYYTYRIYEHASLQTLNNYPNKKVRSFLHKSSSEFSQLQKHKLLRQNTYDKREFLRLIGANIRPLFETPLDLGYLESLQTSDLFKKVDQTDFYDSVPSTYAKTSKQSSDYEAQVIQTLQGIYNPRTQVPEVPSIQNSFKWYIKLLNNTPVFLVLRQKNRLLGDSSLNQSNIPYANLKNKVVGLGNEFGTVRNYHLTGMVVDAFKVALQNYNHFYAKPIDQLKLLLDSIQWLQQDHDELANTISPLARVVDSHMNPVDDETLADYFTHRPIKQVFSDVEEQGLASVFQYDLIYDKYSILCIESDVLEHDHQKLLDIIEEAQFDFVGARFSTDNPIINEFFHTEAAENTLKTYDQMLAAAGKKHPLTALCKRLAGLGLIHVKQGTGGVYFLT